MALCLSAAVARFFFLWGVVVGGRAAARCIKAEARLHTAQPWLRGSPVHPWPKHLEHRLVRAAPGPPPLPMQTSSPSS